MWSLSDFRSLFIFVGFVGVGAFLSPSVMLFVHLPRGEPFSELYLLGPEHMASGYPFNVRASESYLVYLGVGNHEGGSVYYGVYVKFRNASESLPNVTTGMPSSLPVLYEYRVFLTDGQTWEGALNFSLLDVSFDGNVSSVGRLRVNDAVIDVGKGVLWDGERNGFYYQLFAELWVYNATSNDFRFDSRFVSLWLNLTKSF